MEPGSKVGETPRGRKKVRRSKKKAKKDPNEPQKPISAYALFFRDTQATIKSQNADVTFGEVSKIVAAMWDSLDPDSKNVYKEKNEAAKKEYLKALAAYRASLTEKVESNIGEVSSTSLEPSSPIAPSTLEPSSSPPPQAKSPISTVQEDMTNLALETPVKLTEAHVTEQESCQTVNTISSPEGQGDAQESEPSIRNGTETTEVKICLRSGCMNPAIDSPEWDQEYCSSKCVVEHCSNVFMAHVAARQKSTTEQS